MDKKIISFFVLIVFLSSFYTGRLGTAAELRTIFVPIDFLTIQAAINNATDGDTIFVYNGTYYENLVVNKSIVLVGQDEAITVIDGKGVGTVIHVTANNVYISNFTVRNSGFSALLSGISVNSDFVSVNESTLTSNYIGLSLANSEGCAVRGCNILNNSIGVSAQSSSNCIVENSNLADNTEAGINFEYSSGIEIRKNNINENGICGVRIRQSESNIVSGNVVMGHEIGMVLDTSGNNKLTNNAIKSNRYNFGVNGTNLSDYLQNIDVSNTVNDRPIYYLVNKKDMEINSSSNAGYIALVNSSNVRVKGLDLEGNLEGLLLAYSSGCTIEKNNITRNLHGAFLYYSQNSELHGGVIVGNRDGLSVLYSQGNLISNNSVANNEEYGISVEFSRDNLMADNNVTANGGDAFYVYRSSNCNISGNIVFVNGAGVRLLFSNKSRVGGNLVVNNTWDGIYVVDSSNCIIEGNDVTGNVGFGVRFLYTVSSVVNDNNIADNAVDGVYLYRCDRVSASGNVLFRNVMGVHFYYCFDGTIVFNNVSNHSREGVRVANSQNITVSENSLLGNGRAGLGVFYSSSCVIESNVLDRNLNHGIWLENSGDVILAGNNVTYNYWDGIYLRVSSNCTVSNNLVAGNMNGLYFWVANNSIVTNNIVKENNDYGIYLRDCVYNNIFHNSFSYNTWQVETLGKCINSWDDAYPSGGNYWSDYAGVDFYKGPFQNLTGSDGIADKPYIIDEENLDRYPLMTSHRVHDVSIVKISMISSKVYVGWVVDVNVTVRNVGGYIESFNLSAFWDDVLLGKKTVGSLHVGETIVLTYVWNTTGLVPCRNYTVKAVASGVPGEIDLDNNVRLIYVKISMVGDVDGDGKVNIIDIYFVAKAFGAYMGQERYRLDCDLNRDDVINVKDLWSVAVNFGKTCLV